jgi:hypothetical protein
LLKAYKSGKTIGNKKFEDNQLVLMTDGESSKFAQKERKKAGNRPYVTILTALYSDAWSPNKTKFNSFETFSMVALNQNRESQKQLENIHTLASSNRISFSEMAKVVLESFTELSAGIV